MYMLVFNIVFLFWTQSKVIFVSMNKGYMLMYNDNGLISLWTPWCVGCYFDMVSICPMSVRWKEGKWYITTYWGKFTSYKMKNMYFLQNKKFFWLSFSRKQRSRNLASLLLFICAFDAIFQVLFDTGFHSSTCQHLISILLFPVVIFFLCMREKRIELSWIFNILWSPFRVQYL